MLESPPDLALKPTALTADAGQALPPLASAFRFLRNVPDARPGAQGPAQVAGPASARALICGSGARRARNGAVPQDDLAWHRDDARGFLIRMRGLGEDETRGQFPHPLERQPHRGQRRIDVLEGGDGVET